MTPEIDIESHERFIKIFKQRHFRGGDIDKVGMVTGYARDYFTTRRDYTNRFQDFIHAFTTITRATQKLQKNGEISVYARYLLIGRCIELAFLGRNYLVF